MLIDEQTYIPGQVTERKLKPSEAMRLGAKLRPQCRGAYYGINGSCALGALFEAYGLRNRAGEINWETVGLSFGLSQTIAHLNDDERWTREQIADWLESKGL